MRVDDRDQERCTSSAGDATTPRAVRRALTRYGGAAVIAAGGIGCAAAGAVLGGMGDGAPISPAAVHSFLRGSPSGGMPSLPTLPGGTPSAPALHALPGLVSLVGVPWSGGRRGLGWAPWPGGLFLGVLGGTGPRGQASRHTTLAATPPTGQPPTTGSSQSPPATTARQGGSAGTPPSTRSGTDPSPLAPVTGSLPPLPLATVAPTTVVPSSPTCTTLPGVTAPSASTPVQPGGSSALPGAPGITAPSAGGGSSATGAMSVIVIAPTLGGLQVRAGTDGTQVCAG
jgi:hypothetical protein